MSELHKFLFDGLPVRGMLVRLTDSWQEVLRRRAIVGEFAPPVRAMLGEMAAAATLMQASIKFNGALVVQIFGDGPVKLAVTEVHPDLSFRATASVTGEVPEGASLEAMMNVHGKGRCAITLDPLERQPGQQPYQGVVPLYGDRHEPLQALSQVLEHYMLQSEQLDTRLILAANDELAAGLLIQRLPMEGERNLAGHLAAASRGQRSKDEDEIGLNEAFNRIAHLASTLTTQELLTCDADTVLRRLFWEEAVLRFEPLKPRFACRCSRDRVRSMLEGLGREEAESILAERGDIEIGCDFCGTQYHFDAVDVGELFTPPRDQPPGSPALQ